MKIFVVAWMLAVTGAAGAAERPADFAYGVSLATDGKDALYEVTLPPAVYGGVTRADLGDVRVFNGAGDPVPFAWRPRSMAGAESTPPVALTLFPLKAEPGTGVDGLSIRVRRSADGRSSIDVTSTGPRQKGEQRVVGYFVDLTPLDRGLRAIDLDWDPVPGGYAGKLRVEASNDLGSWRTWASAAPLVDLEMGGQRLQRKRIELPPQSAKYLRLSWMAQGVAAPPELISLWGELVDRTIEAQREWVLVDPAKGDNAGEYLFDLRGHYPVDRLRLRLPEANTVARVEWLVRDRADQPWRPLSRATAYRLRRDGSDVTSADLAISASTDRYWLLRVDQRGGGLGAGMPQLEAGWVPHTLVFAARGEPPFQLAYGRRGAQPAHHAIDTVIPGYREGAARKVRAASAGAPHAVNVSSAKALTQQELGGKARLEEAIDWRRWSLWGALVVGVMVLGAMAWRLVRQLDSRGPAAAPEDPVRRE
jgi:hypothetical protein